MNKEVLDRATTALLDAAKHPFGGHLSRDEATEIIMMIGALTSQVGEAEAKIVRALTVIDRLHVERRNERKNEV